MYHNSFIFMKNFNVKSFYNSSTSQGITLGRLEKSRESQDVQSLQRHQYHKQWEPRKQYM